ncbi:MAG: bacteriophage abortive infection AbiH family protein [Clostridiales bacterium]|nr:bacteriophage abortive infection AbiH family protein [Clostridiales bacterium]
MSKVQNILVTGNGFDLYHGRKTAYMDFVRCVEDAFAKKKEQRGWFETRLTELCNVNGFFRHFHFTLSEDPTWAYFEKEMKRIVDALIHFQDVVLEKQKNPEYDLISYNMICGEFTYGDLQIYKHFARIFEQIYDDPSGGLFKIRQQYITPEKQLNKKAVVNETRRELDSFTEALDLYMVNCVMQEHGSGRLKEDASASAGDTEIRSSQIEMIHPDYVINFNFTDTIRMYGVTEDCIFYAKGKAGSSPVNLVLGSPDESDDHADWIYMKNYFRKLMNFIGVPDQKRIFPVDRDGAEVPAVLHFFGYSFPEEDDELIRLLLAGKKTAVIYYKDREDYAYGMLQLIRLFGKEEFLEKIYDGTISFTEAE